MTNANGTYQQVAMGTDMPLRMVTGVTPDPTDPKSAWVVFGGYSRNWTDGPGSDLAGAGHLWKVTVTGTDAATGKATASWVDVSGDLPDVPGDNLLITTNGRVILSTDLGVVETTLASLRRGSPSWSREAIRIPGTLQLGSA